MTEPSPDLTVSSGEPTADPDDFQPDPADDTTPNGQPDCGLPGTNRGEA